MAWAALLRVPAFSLVTVGLGVAGHVLAGGHPPAWSMLAVLVGLVSLIWRVVARAEQSLLRLGMAVYAVQAGIHIALLTPPAAGSASMPGMGSGPFPVHPGGMLAAHVLAGLGVAVWLRRGESLFWGLVRRAVQRLVRSRPVPTALHFASTRLPRARPLRCAVGVWLVLCHPWRGPPLASR